MFKTKRSFALSIFLIALSAIVLLSGCSKEDSKIETESETTPKTVSVNPDALIFVSDPYPPYVIDGVDGKGYMTDVVLLIFEKAGYEVVYQNVPFTRALVGMENGTYAGLLAVSPGREGFVYPKTGVGEFKYAFFVRHDFDWKWSGVSSFEGIVYGGVTGYSINEEFIDPYVEEFRGDPSKVQLIDSSDPVRGNLMKLLANRIDVMCDDSLVVLHKAAEMKVLDKIKIADVDVSEQDSSIFESAMATVGFHSSNPRAQEFIDVFERGLQEIRTSGELSEILAKYGLENYIQ